MLCKGFQEKTGFFYFFQGKFVGAFCSSNLGDVSPNIMGPKCSISGNDCDLLTSKCPQKEGECFASGPGRNMFESTEIIASRLADGALVSVINFCFLMRAT